MPSTNDHLICPTCGKGVQDFKDAKLFRRHIKNHENENTKVFCHFCPKQFQTKQSLEVHIKVIHKNEKNKCDKCEIFFIHF